MAVAQVQATSSNVEADTESALRDAEQTAEHIHSLSGPGTTVASIVEGAQEDLDDADSFEKTFIKPLKIFNDVIGKIADVWTLLPIETELT